MPIKLGEDANSWIALLRQLQDATSTKGRLNLGLDSIYAASQHLLDALNEHLFAFAYLSNRAWALQCTWS